jgi:hypothetical protein
LLLYFGIRAAVKFLKYSGLPSTMAFISSFDREKPLEEQVELPLSRASLELIATDNGSGWLAGEHGSTVPLTKTEANYAAALIMDGYVAMTEFYERLLDENMVEMNVPTHIRNIREKMGGSVIKTRFSRAYPYLGGYYIGELKKHRNEEGNIIRYKGLSLNTVTGCVALQDGRVFELSPLQTEYVRIIMASGERGISVERLFKQVYWMDGPIKYSPSRVQVIVSNINGRLGRENGQRIIRSKYTRGPGNNAVYVVHSPKGDVHK